MCNVYVIPPINNYNFVQNNLDSDNNSYLLFNINKALLICSRQLSNDLIMYRRFVSVLLIKKIPEIQNKHMRRHSKGLASWEGYLYRIPRATQHRAVYPPPR